MDCDDVMLALADREHRTLTDAEESGYLGHLADCDTCRALSGEADDQWRWIARLPEDAFDDPNSLSLPVVDPIVYDVDMELFSGGMGRITKATDRRLGREVAIKEVLEPRLRARFEREALITARLQHPAIVPIYEAGTWPNGSAFYTMRLVWGGTLAAAIARARTMPERLALLPHVVAVTEALAYAHAQRIIHRDLKPGNVLVGEFGETVVIDWGLAKELDRSIDDGAPSTVTDDGRTPATRADLTRAGAVLGTPGFMAVEQASGQAIDERTDVYALGAILYNVLAGVAPYHDKHANADSDEIIAIGIRRPPTPIGELAPDAPADLRVIVEKAMAREAADRYPTAKQMAEELRRFQSGKLIAREYGLGELVARWVRKHRTAVAVGAIATVALAVVGVVAFVNIGSSRDAERDARRATEAALTDVTAARDAAKASVAALLEEQGRLELLTGDPHAALVYLDAAYQGGRRSVALAQMLADATRDVDLQLHAIELAADPVAIAFTDAGDLVTVEETGKVTTWRSNRAAHSFSHGFPRATVLLDARGRNLAVLSGHAIAVWDVERGTQRWRIEDGGYANGELAFDPAGRYLALLPAGLKVVGEPPRNRHVDLRRVDTGAHVATLAIEKQEPRTVAFAGDEVAISTDDNVVRTWRLAPRLQPTMTFNPTEEGRGALGQWIVSSGGVALGFVGDTTPSSPRLLTVKDREARLWTVAAEPQFRSLANHASSIEAFALAPDQEHVVTGDRSGNVRLLNVRGEPLGTTQVHGAIRQLGFSPDGTVAIGLTGDERIHVWDAVSLGMRRRLEPHPDGVHAIAIDRGGNRFATAGLHDRRVRVWRIPDGNRIARVEAGGTTVTARHWITAVADAIAVRALDTGAVIHEVKTPYSSVGTISSSRDGTRIAVDTGQGAHVFDVTDPKRKHSIAMENARLSTDGRYLYAKAEGDERDRLRVVEATTGKTILDVAVEDRSGDGFEISPDGSRVVVGVDDAIEEWRLPAGTHRRIALDTKGVLASARFAPAGDVLAVYDERVLALVDATTGARRQTFATRLDVEAVAFGATGTLLAASNIRDRQAELWEIASARLLLRVDATAHAFTDDGARLAIGGSDGMIRIFETTTGHELARFAGHRKGIDLLAFAPDGSRLTARSADGHATLWDVHLERRSAAEIAELTAKFAPYSLGKSGDLIPR